MNNRKGYIPVSDTDERIYGYHPPAAKPTRYENSDIFYTDSVNNEVTIKAYHIPALLRELRENKEKGWPFANLFVNDGKPMQGLQAFEASLKTSPTTAIMDYWLLRLGGHILTLQGNKGASSQDPDVIYPTDLYLGGHILTSRGKKGANSQDPDVIYLTDLYEQLVTKLHNYEEEMGKLANNPSRHQNEARQKLVTDFQNEWQGLIAPAQEKYQKTDVNNILKNVAAAITGIGLIWLFCKNLYRITHGKGLGLFQFENAHSRKVEHLQKLYADIEKATAKDAEKRENYFTEDLSDAQTTCAELMKIMAQLRGLLNTKKLERKEAREVTQILNAYDTQLNLFSEDLTDIQSKQDEPDVDITLLETQKDFMNVWITSSYAQTLAQKIGEDSPYPEEYQTLFQKIIDISGVFAQESQHIQSTLEGMRRPQSPGQSDSGSSTF